MIYLLECQKENGQQRYIGTTGRQLKKRISDHRGHISKQVSRKATWANWNLPGHSLADLRVTVLKQIIIHTEEYRKSKRNISSD